MAKVEHSPLSDKELSDYDQLGFIHSIPILSSEEARHYHLRIEETCRAIGDHVARLDAPHLFFRWAWELLTHPRVLDCMEQLLGPNIMLKSSRLFYKHGHSASFVTWHQDGITEKLEGPHVPAVWIGLTPATVENGCLRVVPRSHRLGLVPHAMHPDSATLTTGGVTAQVEIQSPYDIVMRAGEMSVHHPVILHASNPNRSAEARIGLSATYSNPSLVSSRTAVVWVRGNGPRDRFEMVKEPPTASLASAVEMYRASGYQILFDVASQIASSSGRKTIPNAAPSQ